MQTNGELYQFAEGEKEAIEKANALIVEAFDKLKEAERIIIDANGGWAIHFACDEDSDGNYILPVNFQTRLTVYASTDNQWLSSTQDC